MFLEITSFCFVFIVSYKRLFITYFHFWKHHILLLQDTLYTKQDHIVLSPKYHVAGEMWTR
jgi:hypothetical protein